MPVPLALTRKLCTLPTSTLTDQRFAVMFAQNLLGTVLPTLGQFYAVTLRVDKGFVGELHVRDKIFRCDEWPSPICEAEAIAKAAMMLHYKITIDKDKKWLSLRNVK